MYHNDKGRRAHKFHCGGKNCKSSILRYLDTPDATSTSNLRKHVRACKDWGPEVLEAAEHAKLNEKETRAHLVDAARSGSIVKAFERVGKGRVTYSTRQHTRDETR